MQLIAVLLASIITFTVVLLIQRYQITEYEQQNYQLAVQEAAMEQVNFAVAISKYTQMAHFPSGTVITPQALITVGLLPASFPKINPFGQSPVAYIGATISINAINAVEANVTYTSLPTQAAVAGYGLNVTSQLSMSSLATKLIIAAAAKSQAYASNLLAVQCLESSATTPFAGQSILLSNNFPTYTRFTVPYFSILVNVNARYLYSGYGS